MTDLKERNSCYVLCWNYKYLNMLAYNTLYAKNFFILKDPYHILGWVMNDDRNVKRK